MKASSSMRLQKFLAERGLSSRRGAARLVREGRVCVNGRRAEEPGLRIDPERDRVVCDGLDVPARPPTVRTILMNKPRGCICSRSSRQGRTVYNLLPAFDERLVPAGRLDKNSEGLLLLSSDGSLVQRLTHPKYACEKAYRVTVSGAVSEAALLTLRSPMTIDGYRIRPARVRVLGAGAAPGRTLLEFVLSEGRKRQVRRMCRQAGLRVHRLVRTRVGDLTLAGLAPAEWRDLTEAERARLLGG